MPKELVYGVDQAVLEDPDSPSQGSPNPAIVSVRWNRWPDSYVAIVSRRYYNEVPPLGDVIPAEYGWHVELDRDGINRLIKLLRKARDAAFLKDE